MSKEWLSQAYYCDCCEMLFRVYNTNSEYPVKICPYCGNKEISNENIGIEQDEIDCEIVSELVKNIIFESAEKKKK